MKKENKTILISGMLDGSDFHYDDDCPICRLMRKTENPTAEELAEAFKEAKEGGALVGFAEPKDGDEQEKAK